MWDRAGKKQHEIDLSRFCKSDINYLTTLTSISEKKNFMYLHHDLIISSIFKIIFEILLLARGLLYPCNKDETM